jgi:eukaryotic-like serine/threonine-protein kinase
MSLPAGADNRSSTVKSTDRLPAAGKATVSQRTRTAPVPVPAALPEPAVSGPPVARAGFGRRLARQLADPIGVALAIFLGAVGFFAGYVASTEVRTGAILGATAFAVVYLIRVLVAAALERSDPDTD